MSESDPVADLGTLITQMRRLIDVDFRVSLPARMVSFDPATQTATVSPDLLGVENRGDGDVPLQPLQIQSVPVFIYGSATAYFSTPLPPGTTGLLVFSDRALERWKTQGKPVDPGLERFHDLSDGIFLPGVRATAGAIGTPIDTTAAVVDHETAVKIGRGATDFVALAQKVLNELTAISATLLTGTTPVGGGVVTFSTPYTPSPVNATKAKAE